VKKIILLMIVGILLGSQALFAEDAKAMPARMGRFYIAPSFTTADNKFDQNGNRGDARNGKNAVTMFNLGFAIEYGINDWITGAVQWAPGWNTYSDVDVGLGQFSQNAFADKIEANLKGFGDLFIGAKMQIVGPKALVPSEQMRFAIGPGVKAPIGKADFRKELSNLEANIFLAMQNAGLGTIPGADDPAVLMGKLDKHSFGFGARTYYDWIFTPNFSLSLFNEFIYYPVKVKVKDYSINPLIPEYLTTLVVSAGGSLAGLANPTTFATATAAARAAADAKAEQEVNYRFDTKFELEAHLDYTHLTEAKKPILLHLGIPVNYALNPDVKIDGDKVSDTGNQALQVKPNASIFFAGWPLPMQFQFQYNGTVWGENTNSTNTFVAQIRVYFKF
jgi:hypothetical protein